MLKDFQKIVNNLGFRFIILTIPQSLEGLLFITQIDRKQSI